MLGRYPVERMPSFYECADALLLKPEERADLFDDDSEASYSPIWPRAFRWSPCWMVRAQTSCVAPARELPVRRAIRPSWPRAVLRLASASREELAAMGRKAHEVSRR